MNVKVIGARKSFVTVSGKGFRSKPMELGKWKWIVFTLVIVFLICAVFLPLYILTWQTFMEGERGLFPSNFTLHYWIGEAGTLGKSGTLLGEGRPVFCVILKSTEGPGIQSNCRLLFLFYPVSWEFFWVMQL